MADVETLLIQVLTTYVAHFLGEDQIQILDAEPASRPGGEQHRAPSAKNLQTLDSSIVPMLPLHVPWRRSAFHVILVVEKMLIGTEPCRYI